MPQILPMNILLMLIILIFSMLLLKNSIEMLWKSSPKKLKMNKLKLSDKFFLSLFISFDPSTSIFKELNWIILIFLSSLTLINFWNSPTRIYMIFCNLYTKISEQLEIALKSKKDGSKGIFMALFFMIFLTNMMGLFPNIFTTTSHISLNMMISFPMWMGFMIFGWSKFTNKMFMHLVPMGTPTPLISFMVMIELISNVIRSLTLSIRLMANMVSGHLLLTLMGNMMENSSILMIIVLSLVQSILTSLELGVAFIQAYVFCMLLTLYSDESEY